METWLRAWYGMLYINHIDMSINSKPSMHSTQSSVLRTSHLFLSEPKNISDFCKLFLLWHGVSCRAGENKRSACTRGKAVNSIFNDQMLLSGGYHRSQIKARMDLSSRLHHVTKADSGAVITEKGDLNTVETTVFKQQSRSIYLIC